MQISDEQRQFLESHRLCVFGFNRRNGPPSLSPVYYFMDGDEIVISTTESRVKAKAVQRNPEVSICVLDEKMPFAYLTIYGHARIEEEGAADVMRRIGEAMSGSPGSEAALPVLEQRVKEEGRVVICVKPAEVVSTRPRARPSE
ncbi:MAG TPA: PPOX class F420-dependent oxidoreductase [Dehalococcoidia bacterium]